MWLPDGAKGVFEGSATGSTQFSMLDGAPFGYQDSPGQTSTPHLSLPASMPPSIASYLTALACATIYIVGKWSIVFKYRGTSTDVTMLIISID